ncbi:MULTISPECIES: N-6 DNA methylase [Actinomadura]|uniref:N-6 DNA methylase n=2 Tax=Actinomadura yumaensis TaxID=111807 RepID=A0ABW2D0X2_9ACTN|nr:N-6 DNA methylase [Actinomadura sp. J1-007]
MSDAPTTLLGQDLDPSSTRIAAARLRLRTTQRPPTAPAPAHGPEHRPGPEHGPAPRPDLGPEPAPAPGARPTPRLGPGLGPGLGPEQGPGPAPGPAPGRGSGPTHGPVPKPELGTEPAPAPGSGPGPEEAPEQGPALRPELGLGPEQGPAPEVGPGPEQGSGLAAEQQREPEHEARAGEEVRSESEAGDGEAEPRAGEAGLRAAETGPRAGEAGSGAAETGPQSAEAGYGAAGAGAGEVGKVEVRAGDSLRGAAFGGGVADVVVCDPPFAGVGWDPDAVAADPRWEYGLPSRAESELAWVQHALWCVKPGGLAIVLMPAVAAARRSGRRVRAQLLRRGALRAVLSVDGHHLWLLRHPEGGAPSSVLMGEADGAEELVGLWREFQRRPDIDRPGVGRGVPVIELLDDDVDLRPGRHLSPSGVEETAERFAETWGRLSRLIDGFGELAPRAEPARRDVPMVSVAELERLGSLHLRPVTGRDGTGDSPVLTVEDVLAGRGPTGRGTAGARSVVGQSGDVAVVTGPRLAARVIERDGTVLGPHLVLVSMRDVDPYFFAGVLRSSGNARAAASATTGGRADLNRVQIPRLPLDEQRALGQMLRRGQELEAALRTAADLSGELVQLLADGVALGRLRQEGS